MELQRITNAIYIFFLSFFYLYCLSVCLYVSCLCLSAMLPDLNKMMIMMMMMMMMMMIML